MISLVVTLVLSQPVLVPAEVKDDPLATAMHTWHRGERVSGFVPFLGSGIASATAGGLLIGSNTQLSRAAGWPLLTIGALEVLAGLYFGISSFGKEAELDALLITDRATFLERERARVQRITHLIQPVLFGLEAALAIGGGITAGIGALQKDDLALGLGLGLAVQGLVLFLLDWAVFDRAQAYESVLGH